MSSSLETVQFIVDQIDPACGVTYRPMFGEYTLYSNGKVVGLVADDLLFIKPTDAGKKFIGDFKEAPAYPGAKPSLLIGDKIEDADWLSELIRITEKALPVPKPKKGSSKK
ncbi:MAG TPA: TfoX/Sxy family protein [Pyrinomonadaceae bacterium]|nr:TfoX/Sxy family protein [Pyrinomonadaceae bacterium]